MFPERIIQDGDWSGASYLIGVRKIAPEDRLPANRFESIGTDFGYFYPFRKTGFIAEDGPDAMSNPHPLEGLCLGANVLKIRIRDATAAITYIQEAIVTINQGKSFKEHSISNGENRRVDSDTGSEHGHGRRREAGILAERPNRVAHILDNPIEPRQT